MLKAKPIKIAVPGRDQPVSGLFLNPKKAVAVMALAHGAGAGMTHEFMEALAMHLAAVGVATLRYQFPYMEDGSKRPDKPALATKTVAAAAAKARELAPDLPLLAGGKSFGGRMTTTAAAAGLLTEACGIVLFGFPLHPPKEPSVKRAEHLQEVSLPMLFLQGTRDELADIDLIKKVTKALPRATLHVVDHADHGFGVLKKSGRTADEGLVELAAAVVEFTATIHSGAN
jgi:predicted alpha/beta-hydrolase family hydrolase